MLEKLINIPYFGKGMNDELNGNGTKITVNKEKVNIQ